MDPVGVRRSGTHVRGFLVAAIAAGALAACSQATSGGTDVPGSSIDAAEGVDAGDSGPDGAAPFAKGPCTTSLTSACAMDDMFIECVPTWDGVLHAYCGENLYTATCGAYRTLDISGVDTAATYAYDGTTGMLVAVFLYTITGGENCLGGPMGFELPRCDGDSSQEGVCSDAGTDAQSLAD